MLSLRRALFDRLLHLPLPKVWDMKTGGILSRLTGNVETTSGLLQMAVVSPSISIIRLVIAVTVLTALNWRLALTALTIIPGVMVRSFASSRRVRPIYRSVRKDVEIIDGRVGETFSGIRVVRAFGRELRELFDYMLGRHTVMRKELFAHRRELMVWNHPSRTARRSGADTKGHAGTSAAAEVPAPACDALTRWLGHYTEVGTRRPGANQLMLM